VSAENVYTLSVLVIAISIALSGIILGLGRALQNRRLEGIGKEELLQAVISAALLGGLAAITTGIDTAMAEALPTDAICGGAHPIDFLSCKLEGMSNSTSELGFGLFKSANIAGFVSSISFDFGVISSSPFYSLRQTSAQLSDLSAAMYSHFSLLSAHLAALEFIREFSLGLFLPIGLLLRCFFATRKIGAALIGIAIGLYVAYPLFFSLVFLEDAASDAVKIALQKIDSFNSDFGMLQKIDLGKGDIAIREIQEMADKDFASRVGLLLAPANGADGVLNLYLVAYPALALLVALIVALSVFRSLSGEILAGGIYAL
jgi:hypothetical protein